MQKSVCICYKGNVSFDQSLTPLNFNRNRKQIQVSGKMQCFCPVRDIVKNSRQFGPKDTEKEMDGFLKIQNPKSTAD